MKTSFSRFSPRTLVLNVLFGSLLSLQVSASIPDVVPGPPFEPLKPTESEAITTQQIMSSLLRGHYEQKYLDDTLSAQVLDTLIKDLDSNHSYFLASDIDSFEPFRTTLDEALSRGNMAPAFVIYNRFQERVSQRLTFLLNELKDNAADYTFDANETLELDREDAAWAKTTAELDDLWRKRLKNSILNLKLAGKEDEASRELLTKRYQNQLNRVHQSRPEDAYQVFMNAVTSTFDPHTQYFSPRNSENFNINMSLSLQGIGAVLQGEDEYTKVVRLVPGGPAAKAMLGETQGVGRLRGRWFTYQTARMSHPVDATAMFHPAYLLRSPGQKREAWRDLVAIKHRSAGHVGAR